MTDNRSTAESPTRLVWVIADEIGPDREAVIAACVVAGVHRATASTQFSKWVKARGLRTIGKARATTEEMDSRLEALHEIVADQQPMTVRQVFYQATVHGLVDKTERGYGKVQRALAAMRRNGTLPWEWIEDLTRRMQHEEGYASDAEIIVSFGGYRSIWEDIDANVQIWVEKDALSGIIGDVTEPLQVALFSARGFSSTSFLQEGARELSEDLPNYVYHFGDYDPSGVLAAGAIDRTLREFAPDAEIHFERIAVTQQQVVDWDLPTRPTKRDRNSHAVSFEDDNSVELDAIPPNQLRDMVREVIMRHITDDHIAEVKRLERRDDRMLNGFRTLWPAFRDQWVDDGEDDSDDEDENDE